MSQFDLAIEIVLKHEGGLVDNPADPGGLTNFGISQKAFPDVDIRGLTKEAAAEIYLNKYWTPHNFEAITSQAVATKVFDMSVNMGPVAAIRILQQALDFFLAGPIVADGKIGPGTASAAEHACDLVGDDGVLKELRARYAKYHAEICINNPDRKVFLLGWMRRDVE